MDSIKISIEDDSVDYHKNLILGQQLYSTMVYFYLCSHIVQEYKLYRSYLRTFPKENLLFECLQEILPNSLQQEDNLRKSYIALAVQYRIQGYDAVNSAFQKIADKNFNAFLGIPLKNLEFMSAPIDLSKANERVLKFADTYGLNYSLLRLALLTRSQLGENDFNNIGLTQEISAKEVANLREGLIDWGQKLLLLLALDYCLRNHTIDSVNLAAFDVMNLNLNQGDILSQLGKLLRLDKFCVALFEVSNIPVKVKVSDKDKQQIEYGFLAVFFLSNFAPDKKFTQCFNNVFRDFYVAEKIQAEPNYRFDLLAYLSAFDLKIYTKYRHPSSSKNFHVTVTIGNSKDAPRFVCESKSKEFANREIWRMAYEKILAPVKLFFESVEAFVDKAAVSFFIRNVCRKHNLSSSFFAGFGILSANNLSKINPNICAEIMRKVQSFTGERMFSDFVSIICKANSKKYICVGERIYSYAEWLNFSCGVKETLVATEDIRLAEIYDNIVNPTAQLQKKLISADYRLVQKVYPLSDEMAIYALNVNLDAYNYLPFVSLSVANYHDKMKAEEMNFADIGILNTSLGDGVIVSVMDSHKPFHFQLKQLANHIKPKKIIIACGYCFASGLSLLGDTIQPALTAGVPCEFYIVSLQNYDESSADNLITSMDKATARLLNQYLSFRNFNLFTCADRFYHGKIYLFKGKENSLVIVGSSNVSRSAFVSNYELNLAFNIPAGNALLERFLLWTNQLRYYSKRIDTLNENIIGDNELKLDGSVLIKRVSTAAMINKIRSLTDAEVQYRLNLWMSYEPEVIAEDLGILALPNYFAFVYRKYGLVVLESFEAGNAYFCLRSDGSFETLVNHIATFSKIEIFEFSRMEKRGYHVPNKFTLKNNIRRYFRR